jgi:hypothetical protein
VYISSPEEEQRAVGRKAAKRRSKAKLRTSNNPMEPTAAASMSEDDANAAQVRLDCAEIMEAEHSPFSEDQRMDDLITDSESGMYVPLPGPPPKGIQSQFRG